MRSHRLHTAALLALAACLLVTAPAALGAAGHTASGKVFMRQQTFKMTKADGKSRGVVRCPGGKTVVPLGGGMVTSPGPSASGEGVYPHSYERLGAQRGWHVTPVLYAPDGKPTPRNVTLQVICGPKSHYVVATRRTVFVDPGQTKTAVARCPGQRRLFGGGFQRTNFVSRGGNYVTASHAVSSKAWSVQGSAFGRFGGELTAIAYCRSSKKPLIQEVSATAFVEPGETAVASTPSCPGRKIMIFGGFSTSPSGSSLFADGYFDKNGGWSASAYNAFGPYAQITAYGYCHSRNFPAPRKHENPYRSLVAPYKLQLAEKATASERVLHKGCYPPPPKLAGGIHRRTHLRTDVARGPGGVNRVNVVYVLSKGASCDKVRISLRPPHSKVFTINTATGRVSARR